MNQALRRLAGTGNGVVTRRTALRHVSAHAWDHALASGHLAVVFPGVAVVPELADDPGTRRRAALGFAGPGAALSHTSALALWRLPVPGQTSPATTAPVLGAAAVHVTTGPERRLRVPGIVAHRRAGFRCEPPQVLIRDGVPVTRLDRALVDAWPLATGDGQRAPLIRAVSQRMTTPERVARTLREVPCLPGRAQLRDTLHKLAAGCHSELELWGYDHVFTGPGMPPLQRQVAVTIDFGDCPRRVYLDVYDPATRTNFELDGAKYHAAPAQREADLRRDAALAALGIVVVRFSHDRLVHEPDQVRREVLTILAVRREPGRACPIPSPIPSIGHFSR